MKIRGLRSLDVGFLCFVLGLRAFGSSAGVVQNKIKSTLQRSLYRGYEKCIGLPVIHGIFLWHE